MCRRGGAGVRPAGALGIRARRRRPAGWVRPGGGGGVAHCPLRRGGRQCGTARRGPCAMLRGAIPRGAMPVPAKAPRRTGPPGRHDAAGRAPAPIPAPRRRPASPGTAAPPSRAPGRRRQGRRGQPGAGRPECPGMRKARASRGRKSHIAASGKPAVSGHAPPADPGPVERELRLTIHGRILDQLGIQAYQGPVASLAELVANAWDADATAVDIRLPDELGEGSAIVVEDNGHGMTFDECQEEYMKVGYDRRAGRHGPRTRSGRPAMGRRGIGKFAGFGIARKMRVETTSVSTGEETSFEMDISELRSAEWPAKGQPIGAVTRPPGRGGRAGHGTRITLSGLVVARNISQTGFPRSMAGRFLAHRTASDFSIRVNGAPIPASLDTGAVEFAFPRDYPPGREPDGMRIEGEWAVETLRDGRPVRWAIGFAKGPIKDADLQGIAVFANGKLAQKPFFFNTAGAAQGQHGRPHMFGQVVADHVDQMDTDVISAERQRINWEAGETQSLLEWGQMRAGEILRLWDELKAEKRAGEIAGRMSRFEGRLARLGRRERDATRAVLVKLAAAAPIRDDEFEDAAGAILASLEGGRLRGLWRDMAGRDNLPESDLLDMLAEANAVAALNVAEAARARAAALAQLEDRVERRAPGRAVRDHVASNPWMISPELECYKKEPLVSHIAGEAAAAAGLAGEEYRGRVDLLLSSGEHLLVLEFMRPGLVLDEDHLSRCAIYVSRIRAAVKGLAAAPFTSVSGLIVADKIASKPHMGEIAEMYARSDIRLIDWRGMIGNARARHEEFLRILGGRAPDDERLQSVAGGGGAR